MIWRIVAFSCLVIISSAILVVSVVLAMMLIDREPPLKVLSQEVLTPIVRPGGKLIVRTTVSHERACGTHVDRAVFDSHTHRAFLPDIDYVTPPQGLGTRTYTTETDIPDYFESGPGEYRATPIFYCNWLHRYYWPITREPTVLRFEIASPQ